MLMLDVRTPLLPLPFSQSSPVIAFQRRCTMRVENMFIIEPSEEAKIGSDQSIRLLPRPAVESRGAGLHWWEGNYQSATDEQDFRSQGTRENFV